MSLKVDDRNGGRSRSRSRDRRSRDEPERDTQKTFDTRESSYVYPDDDSEYRSSRRDGGSSKGSLPYPSGGGMDSMLPGDKSLYSYDENRPIYRTASPPNESLYRSSREKADSYLPGSFPDDDQHQDDGRRHDDYSKHDQRKRRSEVEDSKYSSRKQREDDEPPRSRYDEPSSRARRDKDNVDDDKLKFLPGKYSRSYKQDDEKRTSDRDDEKERTVAREMSGMTMTWLMAENPRLASWRRSTHLRELPGRRLKA